MDAGAFVEALVVRQEGGPFVNSIALSYLTSFYLSGVDTEHSSDLILRADRSAEWGPKPVAPKPRKRLFDNPDRKITTQRNDAESIVAATDHKKPRDESSVSEAGFISRSSAHTILRVGVSRWKTRLVLPGNLGG